MQAMQVIVVGPADAPLFADILHELRSLQSAAVQYIGAVSDISALLAADVVVVLQQWPDEYTTSEMLTLIDASPLARLVVCYGPWCDSDGRTRDVWPLGSRVPVSAAPARLRIEIDQWRHNLAPLPLTATRGESFVFNSNFARVAPDEGRVIRVISTDRGLTASLEEVLEAAGHSLPDKERFPIDLLVWDADPWDAAARQELNHLQSAYGNVPIVAMSGFPRPHQVRELQAAGVAAVVMKTLENGRLVEQLQSAALGRQVLPLKSRDHSPSSIE